MGGALPQLGLIAVLIAVNAAFAGTELALVSLREGQLRQLEARSVTGRALARLARDPNRYLATIQVAITLAGFLASATAAVSLAGPIEDRLGLFGSAARPISIVLVTLALAYITLVLGELAPKRIALQRAERWSLVMARPMIVLAAITRPVVWLLSISTNLAVRVLGGDPALHRESMSTAELRELVADQVDLPPDQRSIIDGAFEIATRTLDEVLVPRHEVFIVDADWSCERALRELAASGHTRAPVADKRDLDRLRGLVHLRQLLDRPDQRVGEIAGQFEVFPEAASALRTLRTLQAHRVQMAIVVDEHGGVAGVVTVEDLVEELVGEIWDEADPIVDGPIEHPDGSWTIPGRYAPWDLAKLGIELPAARQATVAGFVLDQLGRVPTRVGDRFPAGDWMIEVTGLERHSIAELRFWPDTSSKSDERLGEGGERR